MDIFLNKPHPILFVFLDDLKIVHINTYDGNGGAGRAVLRLNKGLQLIGIESQIVCLYQFNKSSNVIAISQSFFGRIRALINIIAERFLIKLFLKNSSVPFALQRFGLSPNFLKVLKDADVVHIHWINHGFLAARHIKGLAALNKKLVWTLHDSNPITGGCHVRYGCQNFINECGNCPVLKASGSNDLSHRTWLKKSRAYNYLNFDFIAPSIWMGDRAREASLAEGKGVHVISNALETDLFKPLNKADCRKEFDVDEDSIVILAGYMPSKADRHKGLPELMDTLRILAAHPSMDKDKLLLIFYGSDGKDVNIDIPVRHRFAGKINNDETLVTLYNLADVFVFTSLEESMGYTALESIACGTPVAAFDTSGVRDVILHKQNGYLAELKDTNSLANGIIWILQERERENLSGFAREWAVANFSLEVIALRHRELYRTILNKKE